MIFIEPTCKHDQHLVLNCSLIKRIIKISEINYYELHVDKSSVELYKIFFDNVFIYDPSKLSKKQKKIYLSTDLKTLKKGFFKSNSIFILHGILEIFNEIKTFKRFFHVLFFRFAIYINSLRKNKFVIVGDHIYKNVKSNFWLKNVKFYLINLCFSKTVYNQLYKHEKFNETIIVLGNYHSGKWWLSNKKLKNVNYYGKIHSGKRDLNFINTNEGYLSLNRYYTLLSNCKALLILNKSYFFTSSYVLIEAIFLDKRIISFENNQASFLKKNGLNISLFRNESELLKLLNVKSKIKVDYDKFKYNYNNKINEGIKKVLLC